MTKGPWWDLFGSSFVDDLHGRARSRAVEVPQMPDTSVDKVRDMELSPGAGDSARSSYSLTTSARSSATSTSQSSPRWTKLQIDPRTGEVWPSREATDETTKSLFGGMYPFRTARGAAPSTWKAIGVFVWVFLVLIPALVILTFTVLHFRNAPGNTVVASNGTFAEKSRHRRHHLHFMFLAISDVPHASLWRSFFSTAPADSWSIWLHCKDRQACSSGTFMIENPDTMLVPTVSTTYCTDLVTASVQLLRSALAKHAGDESVEAKFLLMSDSTLPIKPFSVVFNTYASRTESDFCIYPSNTWDKWAEVNGRLAYMIDHSQFFALSRNDAETFANSWGIGHDGVSKPVWNVPIIDDIGHPAKHDVESDTFHAHGWGSVESCPDENAPFSSIFGAIVFSQAFATVKGFGTIFQDALHRNKMQGQCYTYFKFGQWSADDDSNIEKAISQDNASTLYRSPFYSSHSITFGDLSVASVRVLRASPFLFARKFKADAKLSEYSHIVLGYETVV
eukprot:gnl/TRDRNA2_/TRDRNA2_177198_c4_seq1.p1 gnl/TRDRNA2_/TRDRNA2_177198_c4~~gnl/TRDRNA2_/TRDRNA2_177198_c4_seq1.p1  ORF type:complete len:507 (+),score=35.65 gnl/TRDRNA2_/TRDRNA2_177198_c4_seq1:1-1521(+)